MRALVAAAIGVAVAFGLVFLLVGLATPMSGDTSPKPLLTTAPAHP
ncbi:SPW_0924 family protein [Streptomyces sp. NPDC051940]